MPIVVRLDVMLALRKVRSKDSPPTIGITEANLSLLKSGKVKGIRFSTLEAICEALDCQPGDILDYVPGAEAAGTKGIDSSTPAPLSAATYLQSMLLCPGGGIGRRTSFRCWRSQGRGGSSSSPGHHRRHTEFDEPPPRLEISTPGWPRGTSSPAAYDEAGDWAHLFRNAPGYGGTTLLRPTRPGGWWLTDRPLGFAANFESFTQVFGDRYRALDAKLEGVAGEEVFIGTFEG